MLYPPSTRNVRGKGAMKKGHRTNGEMWINVRRAYSIWPSEKGFSRGSYFNENLTIGEFMQQVSRDVLTEEGFQHLPQDTAWYIEIQSFKKALDHTSEEMIKDRFDGAETVHVKVFDEDGNQLDFNANQWQFH